MCICVRCYKISVASARRLSMENTKCILCMHGLLLVSICCIRAFTVSGAVVVFAAHKSAQKEQEKNSFVLGRPVYARSPTM